MAGGFESLGLMPEILRSVEELDWLLPTDIQDEAIPLILGGGDVMAAAETGSGKTAAFSLPMLQCVWERITDSQEESNKEKETKKEKEGGMDVASDVPSIQLCSNDKDNLVHLDNAYKATGQAKQQWSGGRATHGIRSGKFYYEVKIESEGIVRLGVSSMAGHLELGKDAHGYGYGGTAMKSHKGNFEAYGDKYGQGDIVGCLVDTDGGTITYSKNGTLLGQAFIISEHLKGTVLFPAYTLKGASVSFNFGQFPFSHPPADPDFTPYEGHNDLIAATSKAAFVSSGKRKPMAIILEPARDLAEQVYNNVVQFSKYIESPSLKTILLVGGDDSKKLARELREGVDIVVGTLGKVGDMVKNGSLDLSSIRFFILDEADRLVDESSNRQQIMSLYSSCPAGGAGDNRLQVCFFSATLHSDEIKDLANKVCMNATWVDLKGKESVPDTVHHVVYKLHLQDSNVNENFNTYNHLSQNITVASVTDDVHNKDESGAIAAESTDKTMLSYQIKLLKLKALVQIIDRFQMEQCIVFCRTNLDCNNVETFLANHGGGQKFRGRVEGGKQHAYSCCVLAGMRSQSDRRAALEAFREGDVRFLICTDVAARGIDIQGLPYVINLTLPDETENYIHRIGRVGRADKMGLAISIVATNNVCERVWYHTCKDRGKNCNNRKLLADGGCTTWYNESSLLAGVEKRLQMSEGSIPCLQGDFSLPPEIADLNVTYGESEVPTGGRENLHLELLGPTVIELGKMEVEAQNLFHDLQTCFGRIETDDVSWMKQQEQV